MEWKIWQPEAVLIIAGAIVALLLVSRLRAVTFDLSLARDVLRTLLAGQGNATGAKSKNFERPKTDLGHAAIALLNGVQQRLRGATAISKTYSQTLELGARLLEEARDPETAANQVALTLLERLESEIGGVLICWLDQHSGASRIIARNGMIGARVEEAVLAKFDQCRMSGDNEWGYFLSADEKLLDLRAARIPTQLMVPLECRGTTVGAIWIGLNGGNLLPEKRAFVRAIVTHAAFTLLAADSMQVREGKTRNERDFLLGVSHDLKGSSVSAILALEEVLNQLKDEGIAAQVRIAVSVLRDQQALISNLLELSKLENGSAVARPESVHIQRELEYAIEQLGVSNCELCRDIPPDLHAWIDRAHFRRIISNLLSNAEKYGSGKPVRIEVRIQSDEVEVAVIDQGIGIPAADAGRIFSAFQRFENGRSQPGTGLGLTTAKALMELNNGRLQYRSNPSGGSIFSIRVRRSLLPQTRTADIRPIYQSADSQVILIVDDDEALLRSHLRCFEKGLCRVFAASSATEARNILISQKIDVLVADYHIGDTALNTLLENLPIQRQPRKIVVVSAAERPNRENGSVGHFWLQKPVGRAELCDAVGLQAA